MGDEKTCLFIHTMIFYIFSKLQFLILCSALLLVQIGLLARKGDITLMTVQRTKAKIHYDTGAVFTNDAVSLTSFSRSCDVSVFLLPLIPCRIWTEEKPRLKDIIRKSLQKTCSPADLRRWFEPLHVEFDAHLAQISVLFPHVFFAPWFDHQGKNLFEDCARKAVLAQCGREASIAYNTAHTAKPKPLFNAFYSSSSAAFATASPRRESPNIVQQPSKTPAQASTARAPVSSGFDDFIVNAKNAFPLAAARQVAKAGPSPQYNPFVICGKSGTGKTHLVRALTTALGVAHGQDAVFSASADILAETLLTQGLSAFAQVRALIVDDLQRVAHNGPVQEKLIQLMEQFSNEFEGQHKQMIFACSAAPASLQGLEEGLRSRLEVGLVVELKEADIGVRMRFAQCRCRQHNIHLDREHLLLLAQRCVQIRHLTGVILKVAAFHSLEQRDIDTADLENILRSSGEEKQNTGEDIIHVVATHMDISVTDILSGKRQPACVRARQWAMYLCRELLGVSYPVLGRLFGGRDHSTVMHAIKKIDELVGSNKDAQNLCTELKKKCLLR